MSLSYSSHRQDSLFPAVSVQSEKESHGELLLLELSCRSEDTSHKEDSLQYMHSSVSSTSGNYISSVIRLPLAVSAAVSISSSFSDPT